MSALLKPEAVEAELRRAHKVTQDQRLKIADAMHAGTYTRGMNLKLRDLISYEDGVRAAYTLLFDTDGSFSFLTKEVPAQA